MHFKTTIYIAETSMWCIKDMVHILRYCISIISASILSINYKFNYHSLYRLIIPTIDCGFEFVSDKLSFTSRLSAFNDFNVLIMAMGFYLISI